MIPIFSSLLKAEYRVYQYEIRPLFEQIRNENYIITSTLSPKNFPTYHGGESSLKITLLKSWICKGYTGGFQGLCPSPQTEFIQEQKQSENSP